MKVIRVMERTGMFRAGIHLKAVFWLDIMVLIQIFFSGLTNQKYLYKYAQITYLHVRLAGFLVNLLVIFGYIWGKVKLWKKEILKF